MDESEIYHRSPTPPPQSRPDDSELAAAIAKEIISDIDSFVEKHLSKYEKYKLNAPIADSQDHSTTQFFNLISPLKDVSILGRKLLEAAPKFDILRSNSPACPSGTNSPSIADARSIVGRPYHVRSSKLAIGDGDDANSDDLLAALVESSSSDDFLVLSSSLDSITIKEMTMAALIYIKSHECFTLAHDIQGVIMVLRRIKFLILNILAPKNQMELITKLLTSIGRYSEMAYVFDLFRDKNQFEVLLSKGVEKTPELRIALFNYVKKNPEFYPLVTLNFSMFREIAESLEASAKNRLKKIFTKSNSTAIKKRTSFVDMATASMSTGPSSAASSGSSFTSSNQYLVQSQSLHPYLEQSTGVLSRKLSQMTVSGSLGASVQVDASNFTKSYSKESLNSCLVELVDASDCFAKAGCYKRSNHCANQARLVALQISLLPSGVKVLDRSVQAELNDLIVNLESFADAYIIAEAYDFHLAWRQALFKNVILLGNADYLEKFCRKLDLSSALVMELVVLYKQYLNNLRTNQPLHHETQLNLGKSMRILLAQLNDVELRCKLYTQLNFEDSKEELVSNPAIGAHLKDLRLA